MPHPGYGAQLCAPQPEASIVRRGFSGLGGLRQRLGDARRRAGGRAGVNDTLAGSAGESFLGRGYAALRLGGIAAGGGNACLLDGATQRALGGAIALGAHDALTITFLCRRMIGHGSASGFLRVRLGGVVPFRVHGELGGLLELLTLAKSTGADRTASFSLPRRRNHRELPSKKLGPRFGREGGDYDEWC